MDEFFSAYLVCALWSSHDDDGNSLDRFDFDDFTESALAKMKKDCERFQRENANLLSGLDPSQCGHDFWLTRNGHGAGFWDRCYGEVGDKLTEACKAYGEVYLYVTDDGKVDME